MIEDIKLKSYLIPFSVITIAMFVPAFVKLYSINSLLTKYSMEAVKNAYAETAGNKDKSKIGTDYKAIIERNLFRAKLKAEIPTLPEPSEPRSEKEIEEERLYNILKDITLKGVWIVKNKAESFAVIDEGKHKGVWTYKIGDVVEGGLILKDINNESVILSKNNFTFVLKLFSKGFEKTYNPVDKEMAAVRLQEKPVTNEKPD